MIGRLLRLRFTRNAGWILAGRMWFLVAWFLVTPYVLAQLGPERFGVWSLLFLLSGYFATFDLGLATSVIRFTAECVSRREWSRLETILGEIVSVYLSIGALAVAAVFALHEPLIASIGVPAEHGIEVRNAVLASAAIFALANAIGMGNGILYGLQRMDLSNGLLIVASLPQLAVLIGGLALGFGLYAAVASFAVYWFATALGTWLLLRRVLPEVAWPRLRPIRRGGGWFRYSLVMQLVNLLVLTVHQLGKVLLAVWVGLVAVGEFELGFRVANGVQSLPILVLAPLLPAFAAMGARGDRPRMQETSLRGTELLSALAAALAACTVPAAPLIVRAWVGAGHPEAEAIAQWLLGAFALNLTTGVAAGASRGAGRPGLEIPSLLAAVVVYALAGRWLIGELGPAGVGPAVLLALALKSAWHLVSFAGWLEVSRRELFRIAFVRAAAAGLPALFLGQLLAQRVFDGGTGGRLALVAQGLLVGGVALGVFLALYAWVGGFRAWRDGVAALERVRSTTPAAPDSDPGG